MTQHLSDVPVDLAFASAEIPWSDVGALVVHAAQTQGEKEYLRDEDGASLTFAEFEKLTRAMAGDLITGGVLPGERVAIMLDNSVLWPVVWVGVLRSGAVAVPVNSSYRAEDLQFVLADSASAAIVTQDSLAPLIESVLPHCSSLRTVFDVATLGAAKSSATLEIDSNTTSTLANLQYTSGTTGFPKACVLTHGYWLRLGMMCASENRLRQSDVIITAQRFSYIDPMWNTLMCLVSGSTLVVAKRFSASGFWPLVREHGVTFFYVLGTMPNLLLKQPEHPSDLLHKVRLAMCSGITPGLHQQLEKRWGMPWREAYGLTETGIDLVVPPEASETVGTGAIGRPIATKETKIVDEAGQIVEPGVRGELLVRGEPMMLRYHNQPEATSHTIVDGWLHTGDLVTQDEAGWIHIVGRLKDMVRRGGENISCVEVERTVSMHPAVMACAVIPVPDDLFGEEIKVFVQARGGTIRDDTTAGEILDFAAERLAKFKVPRFLEFVEEFALTPSERIIKVELLNLRDDQRDGAYDRKQPAQERPGTC